MALDQTKIDALKSILPSIDGNKSTDLTNFLTAFNAGIFTEKEVNDKVSYLELFVKKYYGLIDAPEQAPKTPIDQDDITTAALIGFTVDDGIEGHYNLKRYGEIIGQISKTIGKDDFHNFINANKIQRILNIPTE